MAREDVEKDVIPLISNKRESLLRLYFSFHEVIKVKNTNYYYQPLGIILHLQNKK